MPVSDEQQQLQYLLEAGLSAPHRAQQLQPPLTAAGLPELTLAPDVAAVYCDSDVSSAENTALLDCLITDGAAVTIDGAPFTLTGAGAVGERRDRPLDHDIVCAHRAGCGV